MPCAFSLFLTQYVSLMTFGSGQISILTGYSYIAKRGIKARHLLRTGYRTMDMHLWNLTWAFAQLKHWTVQQSFSLTDTVCANGKKADSDCTRNFSLANVICQVTAVKVASLLWILSADVFQASWEATCASTSPPIVALRLDRTVWAHESWSLTFNWKHLTAWLQEHELESKHKISKTIRSTPSLWEYFTGRCMMQLTT